MVEIDGAFDSVLILLLARRLHLLGQFAQRLRVCLGHFVEPSEGFFRRSLPGNGCIEELIEILRGNERKKDARCQDSTIAKASEVGAAVVAVLTGDKSLNVR